MAARLAVPLAWSTASGLGGATEARESVGGGDMGMFFIAPRDRNGPRRGLFGHARYENSERRIPSVDVLIARSHAILAGRSNHRC